MGAAHSHFSGIYTEHPRFTIFPTGSHYKLLPGPFQCGPWMGKEANSLNQHLKTTCNPYPSCWLQLLVINLCLPLFLPTKAFHACIAAPKVPSENIMCPCVPSSSPLGEKGRGEWKPRLILPGKLSIFVAPWTAPGQWFGNRTHVQTFGNASFIICISL